MAKILIVDDSPTVRKYHGLILNAMGHQTFEATDGSTALEALISENVDMVITDINMPRMDGVQFLAEIREMTEYSALPVLIVSSQEQNADMEKAECLGANIYLAKPTDMETLSLWIRRLLPESEKREL